MGALLTAGIEHRDVLDFAACGRNTTHGTRAARAKHNNAVAIPGAHSDRCSWNFGNGLRRSSAEIDLLQRAAHRERQELSIRRPERAPGAFGTGQLTGL